MRLGMPQPMWRDAGFNLVGQAAPLAVALVAVPIIVRHLSPADFGLLGTAWSVLAYLSLLDLGLGRAATKFVSAALAAADHEQLSATIAQSLAGQACLGLASGGVLAAVAPWLVAGPLALRGEAAAQAVVVFRLLAAAVPFTLLMWGFRAVLEGARRFDLSNLVRGPVGALSYLAPAVAAALGASVEGITVLLLLARVAGCLGAGLAVRRCLPGRLALRRARFRLWREFATFTGWASVSSVLSPLLVYAERFVLAALAGLPAVAYYTPPAEAAGRLLIVPGSVASAIFPVLSAAERRGEWQEAHALASRASYGLAALLLLPVAVGVLLAPWLLGIWLGPAYAQHGALVLRILLVGVFVNALAHIPHSYLQALGRPDLTAKIHLAEVPVYLAVVIALVRRFGLPGAAAAWTLRVSVDAALLFAVTRAVRRARV